MTLIDSVNRKYWGSNCWWWHADTLWNCR